MMTDLTAKHCEACRRDAPTVSREQIEEFSPQIPDWKRIAVDGIDRLQREFAFKDFADAMDFTHRVAELAESESHHPALLTEWGRVTVSWWTHKIRGLHVNDFIMAAKTDRLFE